MIFFKLIINEIYKILKRKIIYVFLLFAIISVVVSCILCNYKKQEILNSKEYNGYSKEAFEFSKADMELRIITGMDVDKEISEFEKMILAQNVKIYDIILEIGPENIFTAPYKGSTLILLQDSYRRLLSLDKNENKMEYAEQEGDIEREWDLLKNGSFEEYIEFKKELLQISYNKKEITEQEYNEKIAIINEESRYESEKYSDLNKNVKSQVLMSKRQREDALDNRVYINSGQVKYLTDKDVERIKNQILIDTYRLENNILPYYDDFSHSKINLNSYSRYKYNEYANNISIICIGVLMIIISCSTISEEFSKGTIKFSLIMPYSRVKLLAAKIVSAIIIAIILIFIISQISIIIGDVSFGANTNNYLFVKDAEVKVMSTYLYEFIQYLLRIPEIIICILLGITISTLTESTAISSIVATVIFVGTSSINSFITSNRVALEVSKYLPFNNFNFVDKILPLEKYISVDGPSIPEMSLSYSIISLVYISILLIITSFDSFRKKDI